MDTNQEENQNSLRSYQIPGSELIKARTLNSMYALGKIEITGNDGLEYRMDVSEILKLIQKEKFQATKKSKYYHLTLIEN